MDIRFIVIRLYSSDHYFSFLLNLYNGISLERNNVMMA